jgi:hypothetical protein
LGVAPFNICVQNALKLAYTCIYQLKSFSGVITGAPFQRGEREGKREGGIRKMEGMKWEGKIKWEGKKTGDGEGREEG